MQELGLENKRNYFSVVVVAVIVVVVVSRQIVNN